MKVTFKKWFTLVLFFGMGLNAHAQEGEAEMIDVIPVLPETDLSIVTGAGTPTVSPNPNQPAGQPNPTSTTPTPNPLAPGQELINLDEGVKMIKIIQHTYTPSQRDPFISHQVVSPFVTEEVIEETGEPAEEIKLPSKKEIEDWLTGDPKDPEATPPMIQITGISTGDTGGGYALANTLSSKNGEVGYRNRVLKPGEIVKIPLDGNALAKFGQAFIFWDWADPASSTPVLTLETIRIHERHLNLPIDKNGKVIEAETPEEALSSVGFRIKPTKEKKSKSPIEEVFVPYINDHGIEDEQ